MKTFDQVIEQVNMAYDEIKRLEKERESANGKWLKIDDLFERREVFKKAKEELIAIEENLTSAKIGHALLRNNARVALFNDVVPVFLEVLKKYKGKPYGEKTRDKICQEIVEKTGSRAYIRTKYDQDTIDIYPPSIGNTYSITVGITRDPETGDERRLLVNNKIKPLPFEAFKIWYIKDKYFEDIPDAIMQIKALHANARRLQDQLHEVCGQFNQFAVDGIVSPTYSTCVSNYIV